MAATLKLSGEEEKPPRNAGLRRGNSWLDHWPGAARTRAGQITLLIAITLLSILVHGYHVGTDDAAIYVPGIKKAADPSLYPSGSDFFMHHAGLSVFPDLVAGVTRLAHLSIEWSMLLWFAFAQFLLLWSAYQLAEQCFRSERARWAGVGLLAALLCVPVAGTALIIADSYLTARSLSTPLVLLSAACFLGGRTRAAWLWLLSAFLVHPQMAIYGAGFGLLMAIEARSRERVGFVEAAPVLLFDIPLSRPLPARPGRLPRGADVARVLPSHYVALVGVGGSDRATRDPGGLLAGVSENGGAGLFARSKNPDRTGTDIDGGGATAGQRR